MAEEAQGQIKPRNRASDGGVLCRIALRASQLWDFIDNRQIDAHVLTVFIGYGTAKIIAWSFAFAAAHPDSALMVGAIMGPWSLLQGAAIKFHFDARA